MATINLSWTPDNGPTSVSQTVQRKLASDSTWADLATGLATTANSYSDTTAVENTLYDYRVLNVCSAGGPTASGTVQADKMVCPDITTTITSGEEDVISWTVAATTNDVTITTIVIIDGNGTTVETNTVNAATAQSGTYDTGQDYGATYTVRATITDGVFTQVCDRTVTIGSAPACGAPTGLSATPQ